MIASPSSAFDQAQAAPVRQVLCVFNRSSGTGLGDRLRTLVETRLKAGLEGTAAVETAVVSSHAEARAAARAFTSSCSPGAIIAGGGGGTLRAIVEGLADASEGGSLPGSVSVGALRLGSGNVVAIQFGVPLNPLRAIEEIAASLRQGRSAPCSVMRCRMGLRNGTFDVRHGVTMCGLGQFGRAPGDLARWHRRLPRLRRLLAGRWGIERINDLEYLTAMVTRTCWSALWPRACEQVELRIRGHTERLRLLAGVVMNFPIKTLPFDPGVRIEEPALSFHYVPAVSPPRSLARLTPRRLAASVQRIKLEPGDRLEVRFLDDPTIEFFLDEDPELACGSLAVEPAGLVRFIPCLEYFSRQEADKP